MCSGSSSSFVHVEQEEASQEDEEKKGLVDVEQGESGGSVGVDRVVV